MRQPAAMNVAKGVGVANEATLERRRRTIEYGYRVCGLWLGDLLGDRPRICVMPMGHSSSPHRDIEGEDLLEAGCVAPG